MFYGRSAASIRYLVYPSPTVFNLTRTTTTIGLALSSAAAIWGWVFSRTRLLFSCHRYAIEQILFAWKHLYNSSSVEVHTSIRITYSPIFSCAPFFIRADLFLCRRMDILREAIVPQLWSSPHIRSVDILYDICIVADNVRIDNIRNHRPTGLKFQILSLAIRINVITVYGNCFNSVLYSLLQHL